MKKIILLCVVLPLFALFAILFYQKENLNAAIATLLTTHNSNFDTIEAIQLQKESPTVTRYRHTLTLQLKNGHSLSLINRIRPRSRSHQKFNFVLYLKSIRFFLIHHDFQKTSGWLLIHDTTGQITNLPDLPQFSQDNQRFLTQKNGLKIFHIKKGKVTQEWATTIPVQNAQWLSPTKVTYTSISEPKKQINLRLGRVY